MGSQLPAVQHLSTVDWDSDAAIDNSAYQMAFNHTMEKYNLNDAMAYEKVEVLMLQWANDSSDLSSDDEVAKLKDVLEQKFHYHALVRSLDVDSSRNIQLQVNKIVLEFVWEHTGPNILLIVYYAGHGKPGPVPGELKCFGRISPNVPTDGREKNLDEFVWNNTEKMLRETQANVLEIFDCCHAATLSLTRGEPSFFEFLAATRSTDTTKRPGPQSFTSALIYSLERLLESQPEGFTTAELLRVIKHHAPDFPKDQMPVLSDREGNNNEGRIILRPLKKEKRKDPVVHQKSRNITEREDFGADVKNPVLEQFNRHVYTLHCVFPLKPTVEDITALTSPTMRYIQRNRLGVRLRYGGVQQTATRRAFQVFRQSSKRRQSSSLENDARDDRPQKKRPCSMNALQVDMPSSGFSSQANPHSRDFVDKQFRSPVTPSTEISYCPKAFESMEEREGRLQARKKQAQGFSLR